MKANDKLSFGSKLWYGSGAIGLDLSYGMFYSFLNKYLTDVLKLKSNFLTILTPIARIWDGINDPMMGTIVDNTNTKMGKYRPWVLRGSILNAIVLAFLFNNPGIPTNSAWIYVYISILCQLCFLKVCLQRLFCVKIQLCDYTFTRYNSRCSIYCLRSWASRKVTALSKDVRRLAFSSCMVFRCTCHSSRSVR